MVHCAGKSQIHGWGAISKVPHKRGEMIIEYSGETIRQSLADVRERNMYDQVVGAGTYIFKLDDDSCIDATQRGTSLIKAPCKNMAHPKLFSLLFLAPNCLYQGAVNLYESNQATLTLVLKSKTSSN